MIIKEKTEGCTFGTTWIDLGGIMLSEIKSDRGRYMISICRIKKKQAHRYREHTDDCQRQGLGVGR